MNRLAEAGPGCQASPGLVHIPTSETNLPDTIRINARDSRGKKLRHNVITSARLIAEGLQEGGFRYRAVMVTLTYRPEVQWFPRHVSEFLDRARKHLHRRFAAPLIYVWVHESTKAGRPHYHVVLFLPRGITLPKPDKQGWWPHGMTRIEWARKAVGYIAKYASKGSDDMPKGARCCGTGGMTPSQRQVRRWWRLPGRIRATTVPEDDVRRATGGGFVSRVTGERWEAEWEFAGYGVSPIGGKYIKLRRRVGNEKAL